MFTAVRHSIDSVSEPTIHLTGSDYYLIAWGEQVAIVGLIRITLFLVWVLRITRIACAF